MSQSSFGTRMLHQDRREARLKARLKDAAQKQLLQERARLNKISKCNAIRSPLLRLPAEIRNLVYHYVFCNTVVRLYNYFWTFHEVIIMRFPDNNSSLGLLYVSRQVYQETAVLPYKLFTFYFGINIFYQSNNKPNTMHPAMRVYLRRRSKAQIESLNNLVFEGYHAGSGTGAYWAAELDWLESN